MKFDLTRTCVDDELREEPAGRNDRQTRAAGKRRGTNVTAGRGDSGKAAGESKRTGWENTLLVSFTSLLH